mmetsp:Transcript_14628/g.45311  ORF Transcript_14628/g.45311 Transcript_14628/m.45311 type:complete len:322 (+) Transcript_14628:2661-3626(+)
MPLLRRVVEGRVGGVGVRAGHAVHDALERMDAAAPVFLRRLRVREDRHVRRSDASRLVERVERLRGLVALVERLLLEDFVVDRPARDAVDARRPPPERRAGVDLVAEFELVVARVRGSLEQRNRRAELAVDAPRAVARQRQLQLEARPPRQQVDDVLARQRQDLGLGLAPSRVVDLSEARLPVALEQRRARGLLLFLAGNRLEPRELHVRPAHRLAVAVVVVGRRRVRLEVGLDVLDAPPPPPPPLRREDDEVVVLVRRRVEGRDVGVREHRRLRRLEPRALPDLRRLVAVVLLLARIGRRRRGTHRLSAPRGWVVDAFFG